MRGCAPTIADQCSWIHTSLLSSYLLMTTTYTWSLYLASGVRPLEGLGAVQALVELVFGSLGDINVHKLFVERNQPSFSSLSAGRNVCVGNTDLLRSSSVGAASGGVAVQAVGTISSLVGSRLRERDLSGPRNGEATIVANVELGASELSSVGVKEGRVNVCGEDGGGKDAEKSNDFGGELHGCWTVAKCKLHSAELQSARTCTECLLLYRRYRTS